MLQLTFDRLLPLVPPEKIYVVTAASQVDMVLEHLPAIPERNVIIEPFGMNTAPCIALSVAYLEGLYPADEAMVVLPADHVISDTVSFLQSLSKAESVAKSGALVTFGIVPEYPATGYGYIEAGEELEPGVSAVLRFKEKPSLDTATSFLRQGNFYWNSGMFCWTIASISKAFAEFLPLALEVGRDIVALWTLNAPPEKIHGTYALMPRTPVDIGIMEPALSRAVIPVSYGWSDVGSWKALADISSADEDLNTFQGEGFALASRDNYVYSKKFVALIGVDGLCVVETDTALLIASKTQSESVKNIVEYLQKQHKDDLL